LQRFAFAALALVVCAVLVRAEVIRGKVKSTDADKNTITVTADGKDQTLDVARDAKITQPAIGKAAKKKPAADVPGGLKGLKAGTDVIVTTYKVDGKEQVSLISVETATKKKK